eukprot:SAG31_NODE_1224_length_9286_cov_11.643953_2_plen_93_part_00
MPSWLSMPLIAAATCRGEVLGPVLQHIGLLPLTHLQRDSAEPDGQKSFVEQQNDIVEILPGAPDWYNLTLDRIGSHQQAVLLATMLHKEAHI